MLKAHSTMNRENHCSHFAIVLKSCHCLHNSIVKSRYLFAFRRDSRDRLAEYYSCCTLGEEPESGSQQGRHNVEGRTDDNSSISSGGEMRDGYAELQRIVVCYSRRAVATGGRPAASISAAGMTRTRGPKLEMLASVSL